MWVQVRPIPVPMTGPAGTRESEVCMQNAETFAVSKVGAKHLPANIPCQDFSLEYNDGEIQLIVVCDGHGSPSYVRSDVGARLAAGIAKDELMQFMQSEDARKFLGNRTGAVTARTDVGDSCWSEKSEEKSETAKLREEQAMLYQQQIGNIQPQEKLIRDVCRRICEKWVAAIQQDAQENPLTDAEKELLGKNDLVKAYGSTLMAYVQTRWGWLAIHVGDGRLLCLNDSAEPYENWTPLVPWDSTCFLNYTTSLCDKNPADSFRYAFDGTGRFPFAVFACSDGIEDSVGDYDEAPECLNRFYMRLLQMYLDIGKEQAVARMDEGFSDMSLHGSKDDMSLAGIINKKGNEQ